LVLFQSLLSWGRYQAKFKASNTGDSKESKTPSSSSAAASSSVTIDESQLRELLKNVIIQVRFPMMSLADIAVNVAPSLVLPAIAMVELFSYRSAKEASIVASGLPPLPSFRSIDILERDTTPIANIGVWSDFDAATAAASLAEASLIRTPSGPLDDDDDIGLSALFGGEPLLTRSISNDTRALAAASLKRSSSAKHFIDARATFEALFMNGTSVLHHPLTIQQATLSDSCDMYR
jgi:hypothetical protein